MNANHRLGRMHVVLILAAAFPLQTAHAEESERQFRYSDEWSLVSAPPPAGPYQAVNIDPRVPGPGTISQVPMAIPRQQATQELPAVPAELSLGAGEEIAGAAEQADPEIATSVVQDEPLAMPPVPGHYQPVMPQTTGELAAESATGGDTATAQQEQAMTMEATVVAEPAIEPAAVTAEQAEVAERAAVTAEQAEVAEPAPIAAGQAEVAEPETIAAEQAGVGESSFTAESKPMPGLPATTGAIMEASDDETATAMRPEATAERLAAPVPDESGLPLAGGELPQVPGAAVPVLVSPPAALVAEPRSMEAPAVAADPVAGQRSEDYEEVPAPAIASGGMPEMPLAGPSATAAQEQPYFQPPIPGYYDRMAPPAAGHIAPEQRVTSPRAEPIPGQAIERAPAAGYYGRRPPGARGYDYPAPGYSYPSGRPGYWNMPAYGYSPGQVMPEEQNVPPPPVYDSMQYPRTPMQGYR